ncbi:MAG: hypothetical protein ACQERB_11735 [Promethearchaeati archaeon]
MKKSKNKKSAEEYREEIIAFIDHNPSGVTITDIAKGINTSRVTAGKYIAILLERQEVFFKEIGAYKLYYSSKSQLIPREMVFSYFEGLLNGLDQFIEDKEKLKMIGKKIADYMDFPYGSKVPAEVLPKNNGKSVDKFLTYFGSMIPFVQFVYRNKINVITKLDEHKKRAIYRLSNIKELGRFMQIHFYIMMGVIEKSIQKKLNLKVRAQIEKMDFENDIVEFSLEFI